MPRYYITFIKLKLFPMLQENVQLQLLYDPFTSLMKRIKVVSSTYNVIIIIYIITLLKNDRI